MATTVSEPITPAPRPKVGPGEPGFALGLAGFISSFIWGLVGIVLSAIGLAQSKKIGKGNTFALAGIIIGIVQTVLSILAIIGVIFAAAWFANYCDAHADACQSSNGDSGRYYYPPQGSSQPDRTY